MDREALAHCIGKIGELIREGSDSRRAILQIGYNLGRLSELAGLGRDAWDSWKGPIADWDLPALRRLHEGLLPLLRETESPKGR